jgi:acyl carrier protein
VHAGTPGSVGRRVAAVLASKSGLEKRADRTMAIDDDVKAVISKALKIPIEQLADDTRLEDLGAESLDVIEIVYDLEEKFDISISFEGGENKLLVKTEKDGVKSDEMSFATVGEITQAVKLLVDAKAA